MLRNAYAGFYIDFGLQNFIKSLYASISMRLDEKIFVVAEGKNTLDDKRVR